MSDENKADTQPNALTGEGESFTLDSSEAKKRILERRKKLLEGSIISGSGGSNTGNRAEPLEIENPYSLEEGKKRTPKGEPQ